MADDAEYQKERDNPKRMPRKLTVTRVAALRGRELAGKGLSRIHAATTADGADRSGLTALTYPAVMNYALDAAMSVSLANTFFLAATSGESKGKVALYLLVNIAPFAVIAPLIGPLLDRLQRGRRIAMAATFAGRAVLAILVIMNSGWDPQTHQLTYDPWVLYPSALGMMVLSKSFGVLKSAVTPRVLPPTIDLVRVNARLTTFGLVGGMFLGGAIAVIFEALLGKLLPFHSPGALIFLTIGAIAGTWLCMRIPSWVEVTEGEVPTTLSYHGEPARLRGEPNPAPADGGRKGPSSAAAAIRESMRQPLGRNVLIGLWGNGTIRVLTGFMLMFIPFYTKANHSGSSGMGQLLIVAGAGGAAGAGNFLGNALGTRLELKNPRKIVVLVTSGALAAVIVAAVFGNMLFVALAAFVGAFTSAIGKACLDASIQDDLPEESRASAFGRSETVLQLASVSGSALGVLLPSDIWLCFAVVGFLMAVGTLQTFLTSRGSTLVPGFGGKRPDMSMPTGAIHVPPHTRPDR